MIDLTRLSPAPWECGVDNGMLWGGPSDWGASSLIEHFQENFYPQDWEQAVTDTEFIVLARNAFDVMMRRRWHPFRDGNEWVVLTPTFVPVRSMNDGVIRADDPFTALIEAEKWYREHVEATSSPTAS